MLCSVCGAKVVHVHVGAGPFGHAPRVAIPPTPEFDLRAVVTEVLLNLSIATEDTQHGGWVNGSNVMRIVEPLRVIVEDSGG